MLTKIKLWWHRNQLSASYSVLEYLESTKCFISPFFCGETMYPVRLQERVQRIEEIQCEIRKTKHIIKKLEEEL